MNKCVISNYETCNMTLTDVTNDDIKRENKEKNNNFFFVKTNKINECPEKSIK